LLVFLSAELDESSPLGIALHPIPSLFTGGGANTDKIAPFLLRAIRWYTAITENLTSQQNWRKTLARVAEPKLPT
jgi:hypothetical protein